MGRMRTCLISIALGVSVSTVPTASASAETPSDTPAGPGPSHDDPSLVLIGTQTVVDTVFDENIGEWVQVEGTLTSFGDRAFAAEVAKLPRNSRDAALASMADVKPVEDDAPSNVSVAAAGCYVGEYLSNPYSYQQSYAPYSTGVSGYAWSELSGSSCPYSNYFYLKLRQDKGFYQPTVDEASNTAYRDGSRAYAWVGDDCSDGRQNYFHSSDIAPYSTSRIRLCPA